MELTAKTASIKLSSFMYASSISTILPLGFLMMVTSFKLFNVSPEMKKFSPVGHPKNISEIPSWSIFTISTSETSHSISGIFLILKDPFPSPINICEGPSEFTKTASSFSSSLTSPTAI
ncbi:MAG: hypothetical protein OHK0022_46770 [Roseiflexaceae bacterium]